MPPPGDIFRKHFSPWTASECDDAARRIQDSEGRITRLEKEQSLQQSSVHRVRIIGKDGSSPAAYSWERILDGVNGTLSLDSQIPFTGGPGRYPAFCRSGEREIPVDGSVIVEITLSEIDESYWFDWDSEKRYFQIASEVGGGLYTGDEVQRIDGPAWDFVVGGFTGEALEANAVESIEIGTVVEISRGYCPGAMWVDLDYLQHGDEAANGTIQFLSLNNVYGGTFSLEFWPDFTFSGSSNATAIPWNVNATDLATQLNTDFAFGFWSVAGSGNTTDPFLISFPYTLNYPLLGVNSSNLTGSQEWIFFAGGGSSNATGGNTTIYNNSTINFGANTTVVFGNSSFSGNTTINFSGNGTTINNSNTSINLTFNGNTTINNNSTNNNYTDVEITIIGGTTVNNNVTNNYGGNSTVSIFQDDWFIAEIDGGNGTGPAYAGTLIAKPANSTVDSTFDLLSNPIIEVNSTLNIQSGRVIGHKLGTFNGTPASWDRDISDGPMNMTIFLAGTSGSFTVVFGEAFPGTNISMSNNISVFATSDQIIAELTSSLPQITNVTLSPNTPYTDRYFTAEPTGLPGSTYIVPFSYDPVTKYYFDHCCNKKFFVFGIIEITDIESLGPVFYYKWNLVESTYNSGFPANGTVGREFNNLIVPIGSICVAIYSILGTGDVHFLSSQDYDTTIGNRLAEQLPTYVNAWTYLFGSVPQNATQALSDLVGQANQTQAFIDNLIGFTGSIDPSAVATIEVNNGLVTGTT